MSVETLTIENLAIKSDTRQHSQFLQSWWFSLDCPAKYTWSCKKSIFIYHCWSCRVDWWHFLGVGACASPQIAWTNQSQEAIQEVKNQRMAKKLLPHSKSNVKTTKGLAPLALCKLHTWTVHWVEKTVFSWMCRRNTTKGRFQKPQSRKLSVKGGGYPPFPLTFFR